MQKVLLKCIMVLVVPTNKQPYKIQPEEINFSFAIGFQLEHKYSY